MAIMAMACYSHPVDFLRYKNHFYVGILNKLVQETALIVKIFRTSTVALLLFLTGFGRPHPSLPPCVATALFKPCHRHLAGSTTCYTCSVDQTQHVSIRRN